MKKYRLKISFNTKDSKEYLHLYPLHVDIDKKELGMSQCVLEENPIGTFLIDFLNADFRYQKNLKAYIDKFACFFFEYKYKMPFDEFILKYKNNYKKIMIKLRSLQSDIRNLIYYKYPTYMFPFLSKEEQ